MWSRRVPRANPKPKPKPKPNPNPSPNPNPNPNPNLRGEVAQRGAGEAREAEVALQLRDREVGELASVPEDGVGEEGLLEEQQVARLERPVHDRRVMQLLEPVAGLNEEVPSEVLTQPLLPLLQGIDEVVKRLLGELGHVAQPPIRKEGLVVPRHVGVLQLEQCLSLTHRLLLALSRQVGIVQVDALERIARLLAVHVHGHVIV